MKQILRFFLVALISLSSSIGSYAFGYGFFGIDIEGSLDEVTEKLKPIGFSPVVVTPKIGEYAGQEVIFGNDSIRMLSGNLLGHNVILHISTDDKGLVNIATIEYHKEDKSSKNIFAADLFKSLCDKYSDPEPLIIKAALSENDLLEFKNSYNGNEPDVVGIWEFKDLIIIYDNYFSTGIVECSFGKKDSL